MTKTKCEADLNATPKAESPKQAEVDAKARKEQEKATHAKGNEWNEPGLMNKFLYFVITCVFFLVVQLFF